MVTSAAPMATATTMTGIPTDALFISPSAVINLNVFITTMTGGVSHVGNRSIYTYYYSNKKTPSTITVLGAYVKKRRDIY